MKITPSYIQKKEFPPALRGYSKTEVRSFLNTIATVYEELLWKNKRLSEKVEVLERKLREYQSKEGEIESLLTSARKNASKIAQESQEKAQFTIKEAEIKATRIVEEGKRKLDEIKREIEKLSAQKRIFLAKFKALLRSQTQLLEFYEEETSLSHASDSTSSISSPLPSPFSSTIKKIIFEED